MGARLMGPDLKLAFTCATARDLTTSTPPSGALIPPVDLRVHEALLQAHVRRGDGLW